MYFEKLTNNDLKILRENLLSHYGLKIVVNKEKRALRTPGVKGLNVHIGDYVLSGLNFSQLEEAKAVSVEYNKMMIEKFGNEYKTNLNLVLDNNIAEYKKNLNEIVVVKNHELKKQRINTYLEYFCGIKNEINSFAKEDEFEKTL